MAITARVPVTLVTGFLGAGKTTLVNRILRNGGARVGVLVNDFGAVNIDAALIVGATDGVVRLSNGCICCSIKNDVTKAVLQMLEHDPPPEHLVVEASGVSNPGALAETFLALQKIALVRLDGIISVVDAELFPFDDLKSQPLARDQVLASDVVLLNKIDRAGETRCANIEEVVRRRLPAARILRASYCDVPADVLLGIAREPEAPLPARAEEPNDATHGFRSTVFRAALPLRFRALIDALASLPAYIVRAKGIVEVVERPGEKIALHVVGKRVHVDPLGAWTEPPSSAIVLIGTRDGFDPGELERMLDACRAEAPPPSS